MGIYDRNYFQGSSGGWGSGPGSWPPVIKSIVMINIGVFIAQLMITRPPTIEEEVTASRWMSWNISDSPGNERSHSLTTVAAN